MTTSNKSFQEEYYNIIRSLLKDNLNKQKETETHTNQDYDKKITNLEIDLASLINLSDIQKDVGQLIVKQNFLEKYIDELKNDNKISRITIITTAIGAVLAVAGVNQAQIGNMFSAYEFGTKSTDAYKELSKDVKEIKLQLQKQPVATQPAQPQKDLAKK